MSLRGSTVATCLLYPALDNCSAACNSIKQSLSMSIESVDSALRSLHHAACSDSVDKFADAWKQNVKSALKNAEDADTSPDLLFEYTCLRRGNLITTTQVSCARHGAHHGHQPMCCAVLRPCIVLATESREQLLSHCRCSDYMQPAQVHMHVANSMHTALLSRTVHHRQGRNSCSNTEGNL